MTTQCLPVGEESLRKAAELFRQGQVVAFPTETVYGLGADALNDAAVRAIFLVPLSWVASWQRPLKQKR